jgi:hypothetical protein
MDSTYEISFNHEEGLPFDCARTGCLHNGNAHHAANQDAVEHVARDLDVVLAGDRIEAFVVVATDTDSGRWGVGAQLINDGRYVSLVDYEQFDRAAREAYELADALNA